MDVIGMVAFTCPEGNFWLKGRVHATFATSHAQCCLLETAMALDTPTLVLLRASL